jgi:hypothetical protein
MLHSNIAASAILQLTGRGTDFERNGFRMNQVPESLNYSK